MQTHHFSGQVETIHSDNSKVNHRLLKDNEQLRKRIAELEYELKDKGRKNSELFATNNDLRSRIKELESDLSTMEVSYEALIKNAVNVAKDTELRLRYRINELEEQCTKYQAELMNNDPALTPTTEEI